MNKVKMLLEKVVSIATKTVATKIVTGVIVVGVVGAATGVVVYKNHKDKVNSIVANQQEDLDEDKDQDVAQGEENKQDQEKNNMEDLQKQVADGQITEDKVEELKKEGKITEDEANKLKEEVKVQKQAVNGGAPVVVGGEAPSNSGGTPSGGETPKPTDPKPAKQTDQKPADNELVELGYNTHNKNLDLYSNPVDSRFSEKLSSTNISSSKDSLLNRICEDISFDEISIDSAKSYLVGKTIDRKYKIVNVRAAFATVHVKTTGIDDNKYLSSIKASNAYSIGKSSLYYDKFNVYSDDSDGSVSRIRRVIIDFAKM